MAQCKRDPIGDGEQIALAWQVYEESVIDGKFPQYFALIDLYEDRLSTRCRVDHDKASGVVCMGCVAAGGKPGHGVEHCEAILAALRYLSENGRYPHGRTETPGAQPWNETGKWFSFWQKMRRPELHFERATHLQCHRLPEEYMPGSSTTWGDVFCWRLLYSIGRKILHCRNLPRFASV